MNHDGIPVTTPISPIFRAGGVLEGYNEDLVLTTFFGATTSRYARCSASACRKVCYFALHACMNLIATVSPRLMCTAPSRTLHVRLVAPRSPCGPTRLLLLCTSTTALAASSSQLLTSFIMRCSCSFYAVLPYHSSKVVVLQTTLGVFSCLACLAGWTMSCSCWSRREGCTN